MKNKLAKLWISSLALGWLFDFLFWDKGFGINFAAFFTACLIVGLYFLLSDGIRPRRAALWLIPLFGFFAAVTFIRAETLTVFLAVVFSLFTLTLFAVAYRGKNWTRYSFADYVVKYAKALLGMAVSPITASVQARKSADKEPSAKVNAMPFLRGLLIAIPILLIFTSLLSDADLIFSQKLNNLLNIFNVEKLPEYIFRLFYILVLGYFLTGTILRAATQPADEKLIGEEKPLLPPFLGFTESSIVLGGVVALFAAFVLIQFRYFFGGETNIHLDGFTYAQYARRGFGELNTTAFLALLLLLALSSITKRENESQRKTFSALGVALVGLLLVMLYSAYRRLVLYEAAYGFSQLRTYAHVFLIWIGLLLIATIALEILRKERFFAFAALVAAVGFSATLPILNVDAFIVRQNIQRAASFSADDFDSPYFVELSDDSIPPLVAALQDSSLSTSIRQQVGASLACVRYRRESGDESAWQAFHLSRHRANAALQSVASQLDAFEISETYPTKAVAADGAEFYCSPYYYDAR
ncbi:MAG: DUF4173 domain-containing protein [Anaerolineales bacterium]|nr:DUF4173 domain-containing protein [Anaerolineales bacterium]